ncbi:MAG: N-6 DNA methylase, partial [Methylocella sp.]
MNWAPNIGKLYNHEPRWKPMSPTIHEVDFTSRAAGWINAVVATNGPTFPIGKAFIETLADGSRKRRDITLYDQKGIPCLTGEVKLPWAHDGYSPYIEAVVDDAREKAQRAGVRWFFTWNVNELLLWQLDGVGALGTERSVERFPMAKVQRSSDLDDPKVLDALRNGVEKFAVLFARTLRGERGVEVRAPDIYFIHSLESFLERPVLLTKLELEGRFARSAERVRLEAWMRDRQGWSLGGDEEELLLRAAKFTNYTAITRLIFYEALRKRFARLPQLRVEKHVRDGETLFESFRANFDEAREITGDYETVFGIDPADVGDRLPFYDDAVVDSWRRLTEHVHLFDFSKLEYDVIGQIFEMLIGPEERHKYGQYYTRPEVVDIINSFCIRRGKDEVMDPGCGGGTFLVRAYARKSFLAPRLGHPRLLQGIYGVDVSRFATHLSTINLAARDLIEAQNYPRVLASDFFDVKSDKPFMPLPSTDGRPISVAVPRFDAVIGNPPYVRQEQIPADAKEAYRNLVKKEAKLEASGRSDLHIFFWGHALSFLKPAGWLGFLTSSQWFDVEYGFPLQHFLLNRFRIAAIIESRIEPWFVGARVQTAATLAQLETDDQKRLDNIVRFVEMRRPVEEILASDGTSAGFIVEADRLRDLIMSTETDVTTDGYRIRCLPQRELLEQGIANGVLLRGERVYAGAKWGIHLRAPNLWGELKKIGGDRWRPLGELAEVRFGVKTGADKFFYVDDVTDDALTKFGDPLVLGTGSVVARADIVAGHVKIIETHDGERWPIEAKYLEPVVHSLMHIDSFEVLRENCEHLVLMVGEPFTRLAGTHIEAYIRRGEKLGIHKGSTVAARARARPWYDLTNARKARLLWAKSHQYRHCAPLNPQGFAANCNLYTVATDADPRLAAAVLNSSIVVLAKHLYGRPVGVESNLKTEIIDVNMMPVPDWTWADKTLRSNLKDAMAKLNERQVLGFLSERRLRRAALLQKGQVDKLDDLDGSSELDQEDRQNLDDVVLQLLGVKESTTRRELRAKLYG